MPTQVQRRQSEPNPVTHKSMQQHQALKLALGSILTPKRPPTHTNSRHSPGTASPAFHGTYSGAHTPIGSPPSTGLVVGSGQGASLHYPAGHGPNSSEHLHLYNPYGYSPHGHIHSHNQGHGHGHGHGHVPSRLGPGRSSCSNSPSDSPANSSHPSPSRNADAIAVTINSSDIEPLTMPPPALVMYPNDQGLHQQHQDQHLTGTDPPPPTPATPQLLPTSRSRQPSQSLPVSNDSASEPFHSGNGSFSPEPSTHPTASVNEDHSSGRGTPRAKFLETLQGKSAWDALIHGSFT